MYVDVTVFTLYPKALVKRGRKSTQVERSQLALTCAEWPEGVAS